MGASGSTTINFGAFPGATDATVDVATPGVISTSLIEAWILPIATADHTVDEHVAENIKAVGHFLSAGNIRIRAFSPDLMVEPEIIKPRTPPSTLNKRRGTRLYGIWTVGWVWI